MSAFSPSPKTSDFNGSNDDPCCQTGFASLFCEQTFPTSNVPWTDVGGYGFNPDPAGDFTRQIPTCTGTGGGEGDPEPGPEPEPTVTYDLFLYAGGLDMASGIAGGESAHWNFASHYALPLGGVPESTFPSAFGQKSFMVRIWVKVNTTPVEDITNATEIGPYPPGANFLHTGYVVMQAFNDIFNVALTHGPGPMEGEAVFTFGSAGSFLFPYNTTERFTVSLASASGTTSVTSNPVSRGDFHRVLFWYDKDNGQIGIQMDDDDPVISTVPDPGTSFEDGSFSVGMGSNSGPVYNDDYDELGIWHDYLWTDPERTADWNGGVGLGYADTLLAISEAPMVYYTFDDADVIPNDGSIFANGSYTVVIKDKVHE